MHPSLDAMTIHGLPLQMVLPHCLAKFFHVPLVISLFYSALLSVFSALLKPPTPSSSLPSEAGDVVASSHRTYSLTSISTHCCLLPSWVMEETGASAYGH